ncbi:MAG TPA: hypothetical protein VLB49_03750 [Gemmatimonadales bacterium]|nr:hypothetical protein [Gemmatimonadales bacterium]
MFERLRDAVRAALEAATPPGNLRELARQMREAVVDAKVAVQEMRAALARTEIELKVEAQRLSDAERRGRLAGEIQDQETVEVAERFAARHRERVAVLERKLAAQREELGLAERDLAEMQGQLKSAERGGPGAPGGGGPMSSTEQAWRDLQAAGGARPGVDLQDDLLKADMDRAALEQAADEQLDLLKQKLGKKKKE